MPCFDCPFTLYIDASDIAIGSVLTYSHKDMDLPVAFFSRKLSDTEARCSIYDCEMLCYYPSIGKIVVLLDQPPYCCVFRLLSTKTLCFVTQAYC